MPKSAISFAARFVAAANSGKFIYFPTPVPYFFGFGICVITSGAFIIVSEIHSPISHKKLSGHAFSNMCIPIFLT